jgi:DMSO/TMAO reductase YedYZ molybdopterin-dependent catalytic subunit
MSGSITRRGLAAGAAATGGLLLAGCDRLSQSQGGIRRVLELDETVSYRAQRLLQAGQPLAREYREADVSRVFKVNGSAMPDSADYQRLMKGGFSDWRLVVDGLVERPMQLSLDQIRKLPARTQITRHDCVEGWSCIGKWTGVQLGLLLKAAGLKPNARFVVFHCADNGPGSLSPYYESVDLIDAFHPQTILAYRLNDEPLDVGHGAPLRLRLERQLGYKQAKYVMRIEAVDALKGFFGGKGGFWEDRGYQWYAGI